MVLDALSVSLKVTFAATLMSFIIGIIISRILTKHNFKYMGLLESLIMLPIFLPPSVVGYILLLIAGREGILGSLVFKFFNSGIIFTWEAAAIAAFIVSLPMMYQSTKTAFLSIDPLFEDVAKVMGANRWQTFRYVLFPLSAKGIISGLLLSFGRAFGEFGATLMVAGNIQGKTQTVTVALYYAVQNGDKYSANILMIIVLSLSLTMIFILNFILKSRTTY